MSMPASHDLLGHILELRGQRVMLASELARLYGIETKILMQAVRRNLERFPGDFMFQVDAGEWAGLRSQIVTSNRGGTRYLPYVFTEQFSAVFDALRQLMNPPRPPRRPIGFVVDGDNKQEMK